LLGTIYKKNYSFMKRFVRQLIMILGMFLGLLANGNAWGQNTLTIHDGTVTNSYVPVYGFYTDAYLKCEFVYPASELTDMVGSSISSMKFYLSSPATDSWGNANFQVFLKEISGTTISTFSGAGTVVYEGALDGTQSAMTITFTIPYLYNGGSLLIGFYNTVKGSYKSASFYGETVNGASVQGYSYSSLSDVSATQRNFLPKTTFTYIPTLCTPTWSYSSSSYTSYYISNFKAKVDGEYIYQIDNTTTGSSHTTSNYYNTYSISAESGSSIIYLATPSTSSTWRYGLWIDWNKDGDFDDIDEQIYNTSSYITISEKSFTIPNNIPNGEYRMRVIIDYYGSGSFLKPCGSNSYGEAEDYKLVVIPHTYTVTYDANGGTGTITDVNSPYNAGSTVTTMTNTFTNIGYTFDGWNTIGNGSGTDYAEGATFTINEDITLYAQWIQQISTCENFDSYPSSTYGNSGVIPNRWDMIYNGTTSGYEPHISTNIYNNSLCDNNGIAFAGNNSTEYGRYNYIILPEYDDDIIRVSFDYKYENATYGTLTIGYISNSLDENTYTILETPERIAGTCTNVEYILEGRVPQNNRLAFCWNAYNGTLDWSCGIDNICIETNDPLPITLRYFNASPRSDGKNILKWSTAYESQNSNFEICRTRDILSNQWEPVVTLWQGMVDKPYGASYQWLDEHPYDTTYYILVQNDLDGGFETFRSEYVVCIQSNLKSKRIEPYVTVDNAINIINADALCDVYVYYANGGLRFQKRMYPNETKRLDIRGFYMVEFIWVEDGDIQRKVEKVVNY